MSIRGGYKEWSIGEGRVGNGDRRNTLITWHGDEYKGGVSGEVLGGV